MIPVALESMLNTFIQRLNFRFQLNGWKEGDGTFVPTTQQPYFVTITIPALIGKYVGPGEMDPILILTQLLHMLLQTCAHFCKHEGF